MDILNPDLSFNDTTLVPDSLAAGEYRLKVQGRK